LTPGRRTAYTDKADRERCIAAGMNDYLANPWLPEELTAMVESTTAASLVSQ
jgi:CheY-like chemotaxis protein